MIRFLTLVLVLMTSAACCASVVSSELLLNSSEEPSTPSASQLVQLVIRDARIFDARTGKTHSGRTVVVDSGRIIQIAPNRDLLGVNARNTLDAKGRLLIPGLVDAHFHSGMLLGDSVTAGGGPITHLSSDPDSLSKYRRTFADAYLPYGVTLVRDVGSAASDLPLLLSWARTNEPDIPQILVSGQQLVSPQPDRVPPPFQLEIQDSSDAVRQVHAYYDMGIRNLKLYWRLNAVSFAAALATATQLGMNVTAHVDNGIVTQEQALDLGLRHFEHVHPIAISVMSEEEYTKASNQAAELMGGAPETALSKPGSFFQLITEEWNVLGSHNQRVSGLIEHLQEASATLTPTLHVFAERLNLTYITSRPKGPFEDLSAWTDSQRKRARRGYRIMAEYVRQMDEAGVHLAVGTDTPDPGKAVLSELLLLHDAGIPMRRVLRIATLYSAEALGADATHGEIEVGRSADFVLFDDNPLAHPRALLGPKTVIKGGVVWGAAP